MPTYEVLVPCFLGGVLYSPNSDTHNTYITAEELEDCPECLKLIKGDVESEVKESEVKELSPQQRAAITREKNKVKKSEALKESDAQVEEL